MSSDLQWLGLHTLSAGGPGSIPDRETRSRMPQLRAHMLLLNILCAAVRPSAATQINRLKKKESLGYLVENIDL